MIHRGVSKIPLSMYWWLFQVILVLGLASVLVWLSLIPKNPSFTVSDYYISALNCTNSTVHSGRIITNNSLIFSLQISNPNKRMGIFYRDIHISLYRSDGTIIAQKTIPAFYQGHWESLLCSVTIEVEQWFWRGIGNSIRDLRLCLETAVKFNIFRWKTKHHHIVFQALVMIDPQGKIHGEKNIKLHQLRS